MKVIQTEYKGYLFRSRLEARWAVFFDACGVDWEYEPEGYDLGNGLRYLPDFLLHGVEGRVTGDLYVEVKGNMTEKDAEKIRRFHENGMPILVVGRIPYGTTADELSQFIQEEAYGKGVNDVNFLNFETIDGDYFAAHPGISKNGKFELFGDDSDYLCKQDDLATVNAYRKARLARFENGRVK